MQHVLVYSDSLSWGIIPTTRERLPFHARWPGVVELELTRRGAVVRVIEDCLNGRRTVWDDPFKPGRNGLNGLAQRIEINSPLALVILMLGTNDFQSMHPHSAAPANFNAIGPWGVPMGGGATTSTGGMGMPGSTGAWRIAPTSVAMPCAACAAECGCMD
jgi:lysophospholipase L1-like esterase